MNATSSRIALQRVEGGAIGGVEGERGEELPARLDLHASRERRAPRANPLGHLALDLRLERLERRRRRGVPRPDREGDLELVHRSAEIARALERGRLLDVARDERLPRVRRWRRRAPSAGRRRGASHPRGAARPSPPSSRRRSSASASREACLRGPAGARLTSRAPRAIRAGTRSGSWRSHPASSRNRSDCGCPRAGG